MFECLLRLEIDKQVGRRGMTVQTASRELSTCSRYGPCLLPQVLLIYSVTVDTAPTYAISSELIFSQLDQIMGNGIFIW